MRLFCVLFLAGASAFASNPALTLPFDSYRHQVWFQGTVDGQGPAWLLFDSAAGNSTISQQLTRRFNLESRQFAEATVSGAGPAHHRVPVLRGITFSYGGLCWTPARLPSVPHDGVDAIFGRRIEAILGKDLLLRYVAEIDSVAQVMNLYEPAEYVYRGQGLILPIRLAEAPIFEAAVKIPPGRRLPCRFMIDTGTAAGVIFTAPFARRWGLPEAVRPLSERLVTETGGGVGGAEEDTIGRVETVEIGPFTIGRPVALFAHATGGSLARTDFDALIGMGLLRRFRVIFDYSRKRVILEPNANLADPMDADMSGLTLRSAGESLEHIVVAQVRDDTPASAADLRPGDRIISIDGRKPASLWHAQRALRAGPGRVVRLGIERGDARREVSLTLRRFV